MRFMILMYPGDTTYEQGAMPNEKDIAAMMKFNEELAKAGVLLSLDGLHPTLKGARVRFAGGKPSVTEGPFTDGRALVGGYWLWELPSRAAAIEWAKKVPAADGDMLEIRQVVEPEEFGPEIAAKGEKIMKEVERRAGKSKKVGAR